MSFKRLLNIYLFQNSELIYFLLDKVKECIPQEYMDKFYNQIDCINKIQWVLDIEVDLYLDKNCDDYLINKWEKETLIATIILVDKFDKKYRLKFFAVGGRVFSIEGSLPFRKLLIDDLKDIEVKCNS